MNATIIDCPLLATRSGTIRHNAAAARLMLNPALRLCAAQVLASGNQDALAMIAANGLTIACEVRS